MQLPKPQFQFSTSYPSGTGGNVEDVIGNLESVEAAGLGRTLIDVEDHGMHSRLGGSQEHLYSAQSSRPQFSMSSNSIEEDMFGIMGGLELNEGVGDAGTPSTVSQSMSSGSLTGLAEDVGQAATGDQASRSIFVRSLSVTASDDDIRALFEAYGDVRNVYTACRGRGFVVVSYYDLRAAMKAVQVLQGYTWRGSQLELHYSQPRTSPAESGINQLLLQGTVAMFNLDPNTTDEQLLWIFKKFGDVREVRQSPTRRNQKFIEFFDIRHAAAAMRAMNKAEHAVGTRMGGSASSGSLPGLDTSANLLSASPATSSMDLSRRAVARPPHSASMGSFVTANEQAGVQQQLSSSWDPSLSSSSVDGLLQLLQQQAQAAQSQQASQSQAAQQQATALNQLLAQAQGQAADLASMASAGNPNMHNMPRSLSAAAISTLKAQMAGGGMYPGQLGQGGRQGLQVSDSASSIVNNAQLQAGGGTGGYGFGNGPMGVADLQGALLGAKMGLMGQLPESQGGPGEEHERLGGSSNNLLNLGQQDGSDPSKGSASALANSLAGLQLNQQQYLWQQQVKAINDAAAAALTGSADAQMNPTAALLRALYAQQGGVPPQLAAQGEADLQARQQQQQQQQQQQMALHLLGAAGGAPGAGLQQQLGAAHLMQHAAASGLTAQALAAAGLLGNQLTPLQMLQSAAGLGIPGLPMLHPANLGLKSASAGSLSSLAGGDRGGRGGGRLSRRTVDPSADAERKAQQEKLFALDRDKILNGDDKRTTLMIKNIPNKYTQKMLLATIDEHLHGSYDFFYLPIDFKNKCNVGYAFINMNRPANIVPLVERFDRRKWERFNSEKVCSISYARIQGKAALVAHFQNSSLMHEDKRCRPVLFYSDGPEAGEPEPFPVGPNVRARLLHTGFKDGTAKGKDK